MSFFKKLKNSKHFPFNTSASSAGSSPSKQEDFYSPNLTSNSNFNVTNNNTSINNTTNTNTLSSLNSNQSSSKIFDSNYRNLIIYHIDSETEGTFTLSVKNDDIGETVLSRVCDHFNLSDYKEYFGLKYTLVDEKGDYEIFWLDSLKPLGKQLKHTNNVLTFRVKHFPGKPELIESEYVRYLIFLQIRNYLLKGDLQLSLPDETRLASFAVQAALGDYDPEVHKENYLAELKFLSRKTLKAEETILELHKQLRGKTPAEMELAFLEKASQFDTYGAELIVVKNSKGVAINFGVSHNGIITFLHGQAPNVAKIGLYPWTQIGKISYEGRTLKVHAHTPDKKHVMVFKCNSKRICKHLWKFILDQKAFFNFKRGADVPKIKSSSSLFSHKSKFRFSGRCESELIASQNDKSIISISPLSINSSKLNENSIYSLNNQIGDKSSTLQYASTFKRRTFINTYRATTLNRNVVANGLATLPKETNPSKSDANNNNLLLLKKVESTNILNNSQASSNATAIRKNTISNQSETGSNKTVIVNQNDTTNCTTDTTNMVSPNPNDFNQYPNLTSTPQTNNKQNSSSSPLVANNLDKSTNSLDNLLDDSNKKQFTLSSDTSTNTPNKTNTETEEEEFYDHDESITPIVNTIRPPSPPPPSLDLV